MSQVTFNFAHANGFPVSSYRQLMSHLPADINIIAKEQYGHEARFPISNNWGNQIEEMVHFIEMNSDQPVIGVGHSFGALLSLLTCCARPDLFQGLILMEPPAFTGWMSFTLRWLKRTGLTDKLTPAGKARSRKQHWGLNDDVVKYFKAKPLFKDFSHEAVEDYVQASVVKAESHQTLSFKAEVEADIFHHVPHNLRSLKGKLTVPTTLITAPNGGVLNPAQINRFLSYFPVKHQLFHGGGHLFPLEQPAATAKLLLELVSELQSRKN